MLDGDLTSRRRCATSVCRCRGTQAPGQRQWRAGAPADPLHIFALIPHWLDSLISDRAAARSLFSLNPAFPSPIGALASAVGKVSHIISDQLLSPDRLFIIAGLSLPSAGESSCFLNTDASTVLCALDTYSGTCRDLLVGQGVYLRRL